MKAYKIRNKKSPAYSWEQYIILAKDKKELENYATEYLKINVGTFHTLWEIEQLPSSGVIYSDIY